jgi:hypothetical protein
MRNQTFMVARYNIGVLGKTKINSSEGQQRTGKSWIRSTDRMLWALSFSSSLFFTPSRASTLLFTFPLPFRDCYNPSIFMQKTELQKKKMKWIGWSVHMMKWNGVITASGILAKLEVGPSRINSRLNLLKKASVQKK